MTKVTVPHHFSKSSNLGPEQLNIFRFSHSPTTKVTRSPIYSLYTDGASRGNPGEGGAGMILKDSAGRTIKKMKRYLGRVTNNQAEYNALLLGLSMAKKIGAKELNVYLDSELVVKQIKGEYRVKNSEIKPLHQKVLKIFREFDKINIMHIPRELNGDADLLANQAIDLRT